MVAINQMRKFGRQIGEQFGTERVILFGSHAQGSSTPDSDVDLLVIGAFKGRSVDTSVEIRMKLRPHFPVDILIRTPEKCISEQKWAAALCGKSLKKER